MFLSKRLWCAVGAALVWGLAGCGGSDEPASPPADTVAPEAPAPPPATLAPGVTESTTLPANFPSDVPQYPDGKILLSRSSGDMAVSVRLETDDPVDKVADFYADSFAAQGWTTENRPSIGGAAIFANKGMRRAAASLSTNSAGKTQVDLMVSEMPF